MAFLDLGKTHENYTLLEVARWRKIGDHDTIGKI